MPAPAPSPAHALYSDHHGWLHAWLRKKLGSSADAADLAHDTFVRILAREQVAGIREPRAFLMTVAQGLLSNMLRRRKVEQAYLEALAALPVPCHPDPEACALVLETLLEVDRLLDGLPRRARQIFLMAQVDGMTQAAIAQELGLSLPTVRRDLVRAIAHCSFAD
ncbi:MULTISPECIES: sigma-70 family RNA polymerase sigma factor [Kerstersia]|jgi:RNA polymerase sigma-70 factor (ECF subfamily)|uniref:sigma-70 family RNA polymerase sigma factor n=1 Tax=Kerstersia TaxID=257820 RepID=UPI000FD9CB64|nr:sigma-70 family RNA polymerase sigma factor [Kerstersia gyiorum]AZV95240.1 RNA polymerase subunit sigma [Bordetella sp. J329]MCH4272341.1 sigma-70 family RNA polymerase sigma factor [Kerstersia gyiorum]MCI1229374.1 sigma-70 family RNA polymerase sigma factor [Kerstersia gyiorum]